ncbi:MAG TPA: 30S ribosomal protein S8 [Verrucomicrobiae bacterium]|nr:30S ribosomal protein S8 [Verrucomicrobiae bacterium]
MDTIGNLLTSIRNAEGASHTQVTVPFSTQSMAILDILKAEGYIEGATATEDAKKKIVIDLVPGIRHSLKRISTPGRRLYTPATAIPMVLRGLGMVIVSTSKGMMTGKNARRQNLGGELICEVS